MVKNRDLNSRFLTLKSCILSTKSLLLLIPTVFRQLLPTFKLPSYSLSNLISQSNSTRQTDMHYCLDFIGKDVINDDEKSGYCHSDSISSHTIKFFKSYTASDVKHQMVLLSKSYSMVQYYNPPLNLHQFLVCFVFLVGIYLEGMQVEMKLRVISRKGGKVLKF